MNKFGKPARYVLPVLVILGLYVILHNLDFREKVVALLPNTSIGAISDINVSTSNNRMRQQINEQKLQERFQQRVEPFVGHSKQVVTEETPTEVVSDYTEDSLLNPAEYFSQNKDVTEHFLLEEHFIRHNRAEPQNCNNVLNKRGTNDILRQETDLRS